jgi:predicted DNA-binding transcriptional regulator AlpA
MTPKRKGAASAPNWQALNQAPRSPVREEKRSAPTGLRPMQERARPPPLFLSFTDLKTYYGIGYSRTYLWKLMRAGKFPRPVALGNGSTRYARKAWRLADIEAYTANRQTVEYSQMEVPPTT